MKGSDIMKKNTMIKILSLLAVVLSMTACSNTEAPDSSSITTTVTTTTVNTTTAPVVTPSEISNTSLSESVPVVSDETTITTTVQEVNTSTSTEEIDGSTSTETTPTSTTTAKKPPTTVTTTTKATTTKKPATVTTTTKKTTTTAKTTTKKTTTTAKTTTKVTTTTVQKANLTQADINKLVKELQEYSDNIVKESVLAKIEALKDKLPEGYNWETYLEEQYAKTPYDSSWDSPNIFYLDSGLWNYSSVYNRMIDALNWQYESSPNSHIVIYVEYHPNGYIYNGTLYNTPDECYVFYCLR